MKKVTLVVTVVLMTMIALLMTGCGSTGNVVNDSKTDEHIKIGYIGPLSGDLASFGYGTLNGATLAVEDINANGGILGRQVELIVEDGKCSGRDATSAATKLINIDKVQFIAGGFCSAETLAAAPVAESSKVILFSPTSSNPSITTAGDYVFRNYPSDSMAGVKIAEILYSEGVRDVAVVYTTTDWSTGIRSVFIKRFTELGGKIVADQQLDRQATDARAQLTKVKEAGPEMIVGFTLTDETITMFKQAAEFGIPASKFIGADAWSDNAIWSQTIGSSDGARAVFIDTPLPDALKERFVKRFGVEPMLGSAQAYDIPFILKTAIENAGTTDPTAVKDELYKMKDYKGVAGTTGFDDNGDLISATYVVKIVKDGKVGDE
jgi:branched-chain amino acid transport system substrate-binding protein